MKTNKKSIKNRVTYFCAYLLTIVLILNIFMPGEVQAQTISTNYLYDNYAIEYSVINQWDDKQIIQIKIQNTGVESILNWAIKFDAQGEVNDLWNAAIIDNKGTVYVIKNSNWNYEIKPNESITFGYTLTSNNINSPSTFELCSKRTNISNGYDVQLNITNSWDTGVNGEISINNLSNIPFEAWTLSFDTNFTIDSLWNGQILDKKDNHYQISSEMWNNNVPVDESITIGFVGTKEPDIVAQINNFKLSSVTVDYSFDNISANNIQLYSDADEFLANSGNKVIYFYATTNSTVDSIALIERNSDKIITTLVDDGNYASSGDDMKGDGIYSGIYSINTDGAWDINYTFRAVIDDKTFSNDVEINIYEPFSYQELEDMNYVGDTIKHVLADNASPNTLTNVIPEFIQNGTLDGDDSEYTAIYEKRYNAICGTLDNLIEEGKVIDYEFDETNKVFNCYYSNGIGFSIVANDFAKSDIFNDSGIEAFAIGKEYDGYSAVIINAFEDTNYRTKYYEKFVEEWRNKGMDVNYDDFVTVSDLRSNMRNKDIIALSGHGMIINGRPVFCLGDENITQDKNTKYNLDIKTGRVIQAYYADGTDSYVVVSDFIKHYYTNNNLSGSFVFSEACNFMGSESAAGYDESFANAFIDCSAEVVIGFYNSVMANYSRELMLFYFEEVLDGKTALEAFTNAKDKYGDNDFEYRVPSFWEYLIDKDAFEKMGATAFPFMTGDGNAVLVKELKNGDFEDLGQVLRSKPYLWEYMGDARVLPRLGEIEAYSTNMGFISTGIGSQNGVNMSGTQGSTLYQTFRNTNKSTLQFDYDFVSEEPMEFVGSSFDDKFEVQVLDSDDNILYNNVLESINSSSWYAVSGINFDGGDSSVFHTRWKTATVDISSYQNQTIKIKFLVYDVGDSAYDSAVLLDNIICK